MIYRSLLLTVPFVVLTGCTQRVPREPEPDEPVLRVLTYNLNYGLAGDEATIEAIRGADADFVVLQETTPAWERSLRSALGGDGGYPHILFRHSRGAGGLAVLSRFPVEEVEHIDSPADWFPAWQLRVGGPLGTLQVLAVHLRPPVSDSGSVVSGYFSTPSVRRTEITEYLDHLDPELPTIIAGDFNERRGGALSVIGDRGFRSALPEFHGSQPTWRWPLARSSELRMQLDHVAYDERLEPLDARVLQAGNSDHLPVLVTLVRCR